MIEPSVKYLDAATWASTAAILIMEAIVQTCRVNGACNVMLTGGRSAERLYQAWAALPRFDQMRNVCFYFCDERCVPPDNPESNCGLAMRTLFQRGVPLACSVIRMPAEQADSAAAAAAYERILPNRLDVLLLSVGEDGHIASLFPHSDALLETRRRVVPVWAPKPPHDRLTVTPPLLTRAANIFVMALGKEKAAVFHRVQVDSQAIAELPARLVSRATWLLSSYLPD